MAVHAWDHEDPLVVREVGHGDHVGTFQDASQVVEGQSFQDPVGQEIGDPAGQEDQAWAHLVQ